jgi:hypothetical protein
MAFLESYRVQAVPIPAKGNGRPPPRKSTNVEAALRRMLPMEAPELDVYRQALALMDGPLKISERFINDYRDSKNKQESMPKCKYSITLTNTTKNSQKVTSTSRVASLHASVVTSISAITQVGSSNLVRTTKFISTGSHQA